MADLFDKLRTRHLAGEIGGLVAVCSAHPMVLDAIMAMAAAGGWPLLVEATASQVNPGGGYTGLTPAAYAADIRQRARVAGIADEQLFIGADHLGPHPWRRLPAAAAMAQAAGLATACLAAGFDKFHLDTSAVCIDDKGPRLPIETVVDRSVALCRTIEAAAADIDADKRPFYVIGAEVPAPGGGLDESAPVPVTGAETLVEEIARYRRAFGEAGLADAWRRVMAVVVQPGVDFGDVRIAAYQPQRAATLSAVHAELPADLTFEIHATDFQDPVALHRMVADHFCLLKVGPCLTFALREALYALAHIEAQLPGVGERSDLIQVMEKLMCAHPEQWQGHYRGSSTELRFLRHFSFRDRIRYYWPHAEARRAVGRLLKNLERPVPASLLRQYLPELYPEICDHPRLLAPLEIVQHRIRRTLMPYIDACQTKRLPVPP